MLGCVFTLAGCVSSGGSSYSDLERAQTDADQLVGVVPPRVLDGVKEESTRFVGEFDELPIFIGSSVDGRSHCLLVNTSPENNDSWLVGRGGPSLAVSLQDDTTFKLVPDGAVAKDDEQLVGVNVLVEPSEWQRDATLSG